VRRVALTVAAGAVLLAPATADASRLSTARAELEARRAVAPLAIESVQCLRATPTTRRRAKVDRQYCLVHHPAPANGRCISTVVVSKRSRPRRVKARVTIPMRCVDESPPLGSPDGL